MTRFVGRQPILDSEQRVFGYELLFRSGVDNQFSGDAEDATRQMVDNALLIGLQTLAPGSKAFINCTRTALTGRMVTLLPPNLTVLEVLETVAVDDEVMAACVELKDLGYQIALDDFVPGQSSSRLLEIADYIKLDFRAWSTSELRQIQRELEPTRTSLLAEKVETAEEFERAILDGYRYFQGYFFARPLISVHRNIPGNQAIYMRLLTALSRSPYNTGEVVTVLMSEASLCYRLLRLANSVNVGFRGKVTSITQALLLVGEDKFRKLAGVTIAASLGKLSGVSYELVYLALQRASFCEQLASSAGQSEGEQYLIGLLSTVDVILQTPMNQVLTMLPLRKEAADVLLGTDSKAAVPLRLVHFYEEKQWGQCAAICKALSISEAELIDMHVTSSRSATDQLSVVGS